MTIWAVFSLIVRALGLVGWADSLWEKHEVAKRTQEIKDVATGIDRMSDADVEQQLREQYTRKDT